jgi:L-histidine N-alpha-methyltransferase
MTIMFAPTPRIEPAFDNAFARDVAEGLGRRGQKKLPPTWFYDETGSALFDSITHLPEYGLTRAEERLLAESADDIVRQAGSPRLIAELGSGSGAKTRNILEAALRESYGNPVTYAPIDLSEAALDACEAAMGAIPGIRVNPCAASYFDGISSALGRQRSDDPALVLFLGSTIGNFTRKEVPPFLAHVRSLLLPGDFLLVGADLVKPAATLIAAYDDSAGVTAAFNLNLLARINRELGGDFDCRLFAHEARWNARSRRIEMHLRSKAAQEVRVNRLNLTISFAAGETIWTESSHKFHAGEIALLGDRAGWATMRQWIDYDWGFCETLFRIP